MAPSMNNAAKLLALLSLVAPSLQQVANILNFCSGFNDPFTGLAQVDFQYISVQDQSLSTICGHFNQQFQKSCDNTAVNCQTFGNTVMFGVKVNKDDFISSSDCARDAFASALQSSIVDGDKACDQLGQPPISRKRSGGLLIEARDPGDYPFTAGATLVGGYERGVGRQCVDPIHGVGLGRGIPNTKKASVLNTAAFVHLHNTRPIVEVYLS
jgi:hypothetical protein